MDFSLDQGRSLPTRSLIAAIAVLLAAMGLTVLPSVATATPSGPLTSVIVREASGAGAEPEALVDRYGGSVTNQLPLISGFTAQVPSDSVALLEASPFIEAVTPNVALQLQAAGWEDSSTLNGLDPRTHPGSLYEVTRSVQARRMWSDGFTGAGVDIALIDSGVVPVNGLTAPGKVINGPDLSFESQFDELRHLDTFGHGTHMAGIIAGRDDQVTGSYTAMNEDFFIGVAPDARIVSIKVADAHGATDVSQVIAAIDWVVQHRNDNGMNIRVLNLSFGTDSTQSYLLDPLAFAVERAWANGVVVVVAAGNDGNDAALRDPASDPFVIAVGSLDQNGTAGRNDDVVPSFSNCGTADRHVDVIAPGRSVLSLRAPGSYADAENPGAVVADRLFVGSGTSQSAAVVSGVAALLLEENPSLTPDEVKAVLAESAVPLGGSTLPECEGAGVVAASAAANARVPKKATQKHLPATGLGSLEAARGSDHLSADGVVLEGEIDIHGNAWNPAQWAYDAYTLQSWSGGDWNGATWSGATWSGLSWTSATWSSATWSGLSWTGATWSSATWSGATWSGATWSGATWSGATWSGATWSGATWSGATWSGLSWLGFTWGSGRAML